MDEWDLAGPAAPSSSSSTARAPSKLVKSGAAKGRTEAKAAAKTRRGTFVPCRPGGSTDTSATVDPETLSATNTPSATTMSYLETTGGRVGNVRYTTTTLRKMTVSPTKTATKKEPKKLAKKVLKTKTNHKAERVGKTVREAGKKGVKKRAALRPALPCPTPSNRSSEVTELTLTRAVRMGSDCSGMCTDVFAAKRALVGAWVDHVFASDTCKAARTAELTNTHSLCQPSTELVNL